MKNYILILFVILFSITAVLAGPLPPAPGGPGGEGFCPCCEDLIDINTGAPFPGKEAEYGDCSSSCETGGNPCNDMPIDDQSPLILLLVAGASLGIYFIYKNKKKGQLEI